MKTFRQFQETLNENRMFSHSLINAHRLGQSHRKASLKKRNPFEKSSAHHKHYEAGYNKNPKHPYKKYGKTRPNS